jgi:hypothetical protein
MRLAIGPSIPFWNFSYDMVMKQSATIKALKNVSQNKASQKSVNQAEASCWGFSAVPLRLSFKLDKLQSRV